jgi:hypothetical protein
MTAQDPKGQDPQGQNPASVPQGQVRIYQGAQYRFIWPVHLAGWLELGWTTEPRATPGVTAVATAPVKPKKRKTPTEPNPINESPVGANPIGGGSAKEVDPLPPTQISVAATDFSVDESNPTLEADD